MSSTRRYFTDEQGERIGVLLDLDEYQQWHAHRQGAYPLVHVQGKPLSETIREERR